MYSESGIKIDAQILKREPFSDNESKTILHTCYVYGLLADLYALHRGTDDIFHSIVLCDAQHNVPQNKTP